MDAAAQLKSHLRSAMRERRRRVPEDEAGRAGLALWLALRERPEFAAALVVGAFHPVRDEVPLLPVLEGILSSGKILALPKTAGNSLTFLAVKGLEGFTEGPYGIPEPSQGKPLEPGALDLLLVPGLAFDRRGRRLGYGKGYYDRFLSDVPDRTVTVGVGYAFQATQNLPEEPHDRRLSALLTEEGWFPVEAPPD